MPTAEDPAVKFIFKFHNFANGIKFIAGIFVLK
jgi:hypothetical protein